MLRSGQEAPLLGEAGRPKGAVGEAGRGLSPHHSGEEAGEGTLQWKKRRGAQIPAGHRAPHPEGQAAVCRGWVLAPGLSPPWTTVSVLLWGLRHERQLFES